MVKNQTAALERQYENKGDSGGVAVGYLDLGRLISWEPGDLVILAARPSMGKTALALNFMLKVARAGHHVGIFTLETSKEKLTRRFMSILGRINGHRMNQGKLTGEEWVKIFELQGIVEELPIWIDDTPSLSIAEIRARARQYHKAGNLDFLVVDYLQLAKPLKRGRSREEEVSELSRGLKSLAKELQIPVLAISALNRKFADRPNKRPQRSDLRESGAIEFDADKILFLYREEEDKPDNPEVAGIAEVDVDKHKDGPTGMVKLAFQKEYFRFEDLAQ
jgi:replicative DNA helicase